MTSIHSEELPIPVRNEDQRSTNRASVRRVPKPRWGIGALLGVGVLIVGIVAYVFLLGDMVPIPDPLTREAAGSAR